MVMWLPLGVDRAEVEPQKISARAEPIIVSRSTVKPRFWNTCWSAANVFQNWGLFQNRGPHFALGSPFYIVFMPQFFRLSDF